MPFIHNILNEIKKMYANFARTLIFVVYVVYPFVKGHAFFSKETLFKGARKTAYALALVGLSVSIGRPFVLGYETFFSNTHQRTEHAFQTVEIASRHCDSYIMTRNSATNELCFYLNPLAEQAALQHAYLKRQQAAPHVPIKRVQIVRIFINDDLNSTEAEQKRPHALPQPNPRRN